MLVKENLIGKPYNIGHNMGAAFTYDRENQKFKTNKKEDLLSFYSNVFFGKGETGVFSQGIKLKAEKEIEIYYGGKKYNLPINKWISVDKTEMKKTEESQRAYLMNSYDENSGDMWIHFKDWQMNRGDKLSDIWIPSTEDLKHPELYPVKVSGGTEFTEIKPL